MQSAAAGSLSVIRALDTSTPGGAFVGPARFRQFRGPPELLEATTRPGALHRCAPVGAHRGGSRRAVGALTVRWSFITLYALAYTSTCLVLIAPLLVTLALKIDSLVGIEQAPKSLALVAGAGALVAMIGNPVFGRLSDRTTSPLGMRRPWMLLGLAGGTLRSSSWPRHPTS